MRARLTCLLVLAACGGSSSAPPDGAGSGTNSPDARADAAPIADAVPMPDAPPSIDATPPDAISDAATPGMLVVSPSTIDLGAIDPLRGASGGVMLTNNGDLPVTIGTSTVTAPFTMSGSNCGAAVPAHFTCEVDVGVNGSKLGALSGTLTIDAATGPITIPVKATVEGRITVGVRGQGAGVIAASNNVDCTGGCSQLSATPITFTASVAPGTRFGGWLAKGCGAAPTCTVTPGLVEAYATAVFVASDEHVLTVVAGGNAPAEASYLLDLQGYRQYVGVPGVAVVPAGSHRIDLTVTGPSQTPALSGACTSTGGACTFTMYDDATLTVTANRLPHEDRVIELPWVSPTAIALDSTGRIVLAGDDLVSMTPDGTARWAIYKPAAAMQLTADDHIVILSTPPSGGVVERYSPDGDLEWSAPVACTTTPTRTSLAIAGDGRVAAQCGPDLTIVTATGAIAWHTLVPSATGDVSFDTGGDVTTSILDAQWQLSYQQFSPAGAPKGPPTVIHKLGNQPSGSVVSDPAGDVLACWADTYPVLTRTGPHAFTLPVTGTKETRALAADDGGLWWVYGYYGQTGVRRLTADGATSWETLDPSPALSWVSMRPASGGRLILGSSYGGYSSLLQVWTP